MSFKLCTLAAALVAANQNNGNQHAATPPWSHFGQSQNHWEKDFDDRAFNKRSAQCSLAVFSSANPPTLADTLPEITKLTQIYPLKKYDYRVFTSIPSKPDTEPDFSQWLADLKTNIASVDAQVAKWRQKKFDYIGLPFQSTFLAPYLTGTVDATNGSTFIVANGNINQRFDPRQQYVLENAGTPVADDFGTHIARLSDVNTVSSLLGANLEFFGILGSPTGPVITTTKLFVIVQKGDSFSGTVVDQLKDYFTSNSLSSAANAFYEIDETGSANPFFNIGELQAAAADIKTASQNPAISKIVIAIVVNGRSLEEATRDFLNAGIFCDCPSANCFAGATCTPYPKAVIWGANWGPLPGFTIPVPSSSGLAPVDANPSIEWTYAGFPRDPVDFSAFTATKDQFLLEQIKWASQCRTIEKTRVAPATVTLSGDEYKFIKSTKVDYWIQPLNYAANSAVPTDVDKNFAINQLWIEAAP